MEKFQICSDNNRPLKGGTALPNKLQNLQIEIYHFFEFVNII